MELIEIKIDSEFRKHLAYTRRRDSLGSNKGLGS